MSAAVLYFYIYIYIYIVRCFNINFIRIHGEENGRLEGHFTCSPALQRVRVPLTSNSSTLQIRKNDAASKGTLEVGEWTAWYVYLLAFQCHTREGRTQVVL